MHTTARVNPRSARRLTYPFMISDGEVTMRRCDLMNLVLSGRLEANLLAYGEKFEDMAEKAFKKGLSTSQAVLELEPADRAGVLHMLRSFACAAIVSPVYTMSDDGDENHVPVESLSTQDLIRVWGAAPPKDVAVDPEQPVIAPVTEAQAARFSEPDAARESVSESEVPESNDPVPSNTGVEEKTVRTAHGRMVTMAHL